jgi:hypothetical protein
MIQRNIWLMRTTVANFFGGASADKEVQDLGIVDLIRLYQMVRGTIGAQSNPQPSDASATSGDRS